MGYTFAIDVSSHLASSTGVGVYVGELVKALLATPGEDRFKLCAVSARRHASAMLRQRFPDRKICVRHLPLRVLSPLVDWSPFLEFETLFGGDADVFHASPFLVPASKKTAVVVTIFDLTPIRFPELHLPSNLFTVRQLRRRLERVDLVMVPSASTAEDLEDLNVILRDKVRVVPLGVGECFGPVEHGIPEVLARMGVRGEYLLNVGALEPRKNLPRLFQAFQLLRERYRIPHRLVVAGPRAWKDEEVFRTVRRLNLSDAVVFTGYVSGDLLNLLYNHAALLVYPSLYEGFGLPPLEAMAAGCPVAVSRTSSLPEVVGDAGVYFDPAESEEIAQAVYRVLESPELRVKLVELGRVRSREFSWPKTAAVTRRVYKEACELRLRGL